MTRLQEDIRALLQSYRSVGRYDLLSLFSRPALFREIVQTLALPFHGRVDYVASPEAIGWVLGTALAAELNAGFVGMRKAGRLPYPGDQLFSASYTDYSKERKTLELRKDALPPNSRVLLADEWIETAATARCSLALLQHFHCTVAGIAAVGIDENEHTREWINSGFVTYIGKDL